MNEFLRNISFFVFGLLFSTTFYSQEEEKINVEQSSEVFLEEYTDEFQEAFFEALKQKGIQNYDRAIDLFLECKRIEPTNSVIDYELAKTYFLDKQYIQAQQYSIEALVAQPTDYWHLEVLLNILEKQGSNIDIVQSNIPYTNKKLQENLAVLYFKRKKYNAALKVLESFENSQFATDLARRINDSIQKNTITRTTTFSYEVKPSVEDDPVAQYKSTIEALLEKRAYKQMEEVSQEALDSYPLQPYFYYAYGTALNGVSKSSKATEVLESALDYLFDDTALANKIYKELSKAYMAIGNTSKANEYANKIKPGL
ncbi:hypothetical protein LV716_07200 [Flagellimonas sp. HMM57]|uniref:tetratricopeptide repeat protein n=1 Tax=unclassified Flagellimonas TaxID=2644544 RepID=UPI0013D56EBE|nr:MULTISPECIES: hypothetical protein [unclassified Flagellimonas]UII77548.1 hypothetical protein LV716_07200 [Flagellimonas sp. HMM57]